MKNLNTPSIGNAFARFAASALTSCALLASLSTGQAEVWTQNKVLGPTVPAYPFAGIHQFDDLTIGDNVEVTSSNISHLVIKVNGTLRMGRNAAIRVRNGFYESAPANPLTNLTVGDLARLGVRVGDVVLYPGVYGRGGDGGGGGLGEHYRIFNGDFMNGSGGGGGGGFGGGQRGLGGWSAWVRSGKPGISDGGDGGQGGESAVVYEGVRYNSCDHDGYCVMLGGRGGAGTSLGGNGEPGARDTWTYSVATGGGGGGGNGGDGGTGLVTSHGNSGAGGGGGGYGGGVLTLIADTILYDSVVPPRFSVSGQAGGKPGTIDSFRPAAPGANGEGGLLLIFSPHYTPQTNHWDLGMNTNGAHRLPSKNGGHGVVTGGPGRVFVIVKASIALQPQNQEITAGSPVSFRVTAQGSAPLDYQWWFETTRLENATNDVLDLTNVQPAAAGGYRVVVSNLGGSITSRVASLSVYAGSIHPSIAYFRPEGGALNVLVTADSQQAWSVANPNSWITLAPGYDQGMGNGEVRFTVQAHTSQTARMGTMTIAGRQFKVVQGGVETVKPAVTILVPSTGAQVTTNCVVVSGTATDNAGIARVEYRTGLTPFQAAEGTTNWRASVLLEPGTNRVQVKSIDWSGNESLVATVLVDYLVTEQLRLEVEPGGAVTGVSHGQPLILGRRYEAVAVADAVHLFAGWSGSTSSPGSSLVFTMQSNMLLHAAFVPNPFIPYKGRYQGLFYEPAQARHDSSGAFTLTLTKRGLYSGEVQLGTNRHAFSGQFALDGRATNSVGYGGPLQAEWVLDLDHTRTNYLTGSIDPSGGGWRAQAIGDLVPVYGTNASPYRGKYTAVLAGARDGLNSVWPAGDGYGAATVDAAGMLTFNGRLADGKPITQSVPVSTNGMWPLYVPLYGGEGMVLSWVQLSTNATAANPLRSNPALWDRPAISSAAYYPEGFEVLTSLQVSKYKAANPVLLLGTNGMLVFFGGSLAVPLTNRVALTSSNTIINLGPQPLTMTITRSNGFFSGMVTLPNATATTPFQGAVVQGQTNGSGFFRDGGRSGWVIFGPTP